VAVDARARTSQDGRVRAEHQAVRDREGRVVGSRLPQAGVLHWGGTIRPRGVPIKFEPHPVMSDALDRRTNEIVDDLGDAVDRAARKAGWRR
jgi:hypothetical protein